MQKALVLLLATFIGTSLYGQTGLLNKAKDLTKKEDKKEVKKDTPVRSEPEKRATPDKPVRNRPSDTDASASKPAGNTAAKEQPQVPDMSSAVLSPSVAWKSLLDDACFQYNPVTGYFRPVAFFIYFLPERDMAGKPMNYNNYASHILPYIRLEVVNKSKGQTEGKFYYRAEPYALPEYRLKLYEDALNPDIPAYLTLTEGEYSLDFFMPSVWKGSATPIRTLR
jgi:hypothetical protein